MRAMPKLWQFLTEDWLTLDPGLARSWWFAVAHARWSQTAQWREQFVAFANQDGIVTRDVVIDFFEETASLVQLVQLLEALMRERVLLARDGKRIEEHLLQRANAQGAWKHVSGRTPPATKSRA
jgi:hypothetical protein